LELPIDVEQNKHMIGAAALDN